MMHKDIAYDNLYAENPIVVYEGVITRLDVLAILFDMSDDSIVLEFPTRSEIFHYNKYQ